MIRTKVTDRTLYADFAATNPYLADKSRAAITARAEAKYGSMMGMEFGTFWELCNGDTSHLGDMKQPTVLQVYWLSRFRDFADEITAQLKQLTPPDTAEAQRASQGTLSVSFGEGVLVFLQQHFSLHSYKEAEKITMGELLIAKRAAYNAEIFKRNMAAIVRQKMKHK